MKSEKDRAEKMKTIHKHELVYEIIESIIDFSGCSLGKRRGKVASFRETSRSVNLLRQLGQ